jgi:hypothetical protein
MSLITRTPHRTYKVIQWATGGVGRAAIEGILRHPDLELVGCWVHSDAKHGQDVGEILGRDPVGVTATQDADELLALAADCVMYSPLVPDGNQVKAILESGKNLVTPVGWVYPDLDNPKVRVLQEAARNAGVTLHGSGIHPGGITERFPLMISALSSAVTHVRAEEFSDIRTYNSPDVVRHIMGFGAAPQEAMRGPMASMLGAGFKMSVRMIADHMGFAIEPGIRTTQEVAVAVDRVATGVLTIDPGMVAARRFRWDALVDGEPVITAAVNWLWGARRAVRGRGHRRPRHQHRLPRPAARVRRPGPAAEPRHRGHRDALRERHPVCLRRRARHQDLPGPAPAGRAPSPRTVGRDQLILEHLRLTGVASGT